MRNKELPGLPIIHESTPPTRASEFSPVRRTTAGYQRATMPPSNRTWSEAPPWATPSRASAHAAPDMTGSYSHAPPPSMAYDMNYTYEPSRTYAASEYDMEPSRRYTELPSPVRRYERSTYSAAPSFQHAGAYDTRAPSMYVAASTDPYELSRTYDQSTHLSEPEHRPYAPGSYVEPSSTYATRAPVAPSSYAAYETDPSHVYEVSTYTEPARSYAPSLYAGTSESLPYSRDNGELFASGAAPALSGNSSAPMHYLAGGVMLAPAASLSRRTEAPAASAAPADSALSAQENEWSLPTLDRLGSFGPGEFSELLPPPSPEKPAQDMRESIYEARPLSHQPRMPEPALAKATDPAQDTRESTYEPRPPSHQPRMPEPALAKATEPAQPNNTTPTTGETESTAPKSEPDVGEAKQAGKDTLPPKPWSVSQESGTPTVVDADAPSAALLSTNQGADAATDDTHASISTDATHATAAESVEPQDDNAVPPSSMPAAPSSHELSDPATDMEPPVPVAAASHLVLPCVMIEVCALPNLSTATVAAGSIARRGFRPSSFSRSQKRSTCKARAPRPPAVATWPARC